MPYHTNTNPLRPESLCGFSVIHVGTLEYVPQTAKPRHLLHWVLGLKDKLSQRAEPGWSTNCGHDQLWEKCWVKEVYLPRSISSPDSSMHWGSWNPKMSSTNLNCLHFQGVDLSFISSYIPTPPQRGIYILIPNETIIQILNINPLYYTSLKETSKTQSLNTEFQN